MHIYVYIYIYALIFSEIKEITVKLEDSSVRNREKRIGLGPRPLRKRNCLPDLTLKPCKYFTCYKTKLNFKSIPLPTQKNKVVT